MAEIETQKNLRNDDWFNQVVSFLVKHGMLDASEEYDIGDVMAALADNYEPRPADQIKHMAERFLAWKLPEDFTPDGGISFKREFNENTPHPMKHEPSGTNLLNHKQAEDMVRHMLEGLPA